MAACVPVPSALAPLHVTASEQPGAHTLASCCLHSGAVHLWDERLLPARGADGGEDPWEELGVSARRCLVGTVRLPDGVASARQLHLDGARLLASLDADATASAFCRSAQAVGLYDIRALGSARFGPAEPLWSQPVVDGEISCMGCSEHTVFLGTSRGPVVLWNFAPDAVGADTDAADEWKPEKRKREKVRHKVKIRGRYPKMSAGAGR